MVGVVGVVSRPTIYPGSDTEKAVQRIIPRIRAVVREETENAAMVSLASALVLEAHRRRINGLWVKWLVKEALKIYENL